MTPAQNSRGDTIQLMEGAVQHLLPSYATEDDMYEALDRCGLTEQQIFDELDRRCGNTVGTMSEHELAHQIRTILFDNFEEAIKEVTDHRAPLYDS